MLVRGDHHARRLQAAWANHGATLFTVAVLDSASDDLDAREQFWLDALDAAGRSGLNTMPNASSPRGVVRSAEFKAAVSATTRGVKKSAQHARAIREGALTSWQTAERRQASVLSAAKQAAKLREHFTADRRQQWAADTRERWRDPDWRARVLATRSDSTTYADSARAKRLGKTMPAEAKRKIAASLAGRPKSEEHRRKLSEAAKRREAAKRAIDGKVP